MAHGAQSVTTTLTYKTLMWFARCQVTREPGQQNAVDFMAQALVCRYGWTMLIALGMNPHYRNVLTEAGEATQASVVITMMSGCIVYLIQL